MRGCNISCPYVVIEVLSHVLLVLPSRVHISSVTLEHLNGAYKVEAGDGQSRDSYLKEHGIVTYLVINPKVQYHQNKGVSLVLIAISNLKDVN